MGQKFQSRDKIPKSESTAHNMARFELMFRNNGLLHLMQ